MHARRQHPLRSVIASVIATFSLTGVAARNAFAASTESPQTAACDSGSHVDDMACQSERVKSLDAELNRVYQQALMALPQKSAQDVRKGRDQLRRSQRAWLAYLHANCALEGGLQGGSNSYVSSFAADCEARELARRIAFLKSIAQQNP